RLHARRHLLPLNFDQVLWENVRRAQSICFPFTVGHRVLERMRMADSIDLDYPFVGRWLVQNSLANRIPSHGTTLFATSYAIDFAPVDDTGRTAPITLSSLLRPEPPENFPGFGRPILAP